MLHGFLAHARCFAFIAPYLAADYHVVAYDLSGMGDSDTRDTYPDQVRVDELMGVAEQTGLFEHDSKPTIIAHTFGGHVGVNTVHAHPDRPNRIYPDFATAKQRYVLSPPQPVEEKVLFDYMAYHSLKQVEGVIQLLAVAVFPVGGWYRGGRRVAGKRFVCRRLRTSG